MRYFETDVFTAKSGYGNPVAIVLDAVALSTESMQRFANWTNFSETTFVTEVKPHAYTLRIFTPFCELPFAGHPSVGTAQTLLKQGLITPDNQGQCVQHCGAGALPLRVAHDRVSIRVPLRASRNVQDQADAIFAYTHSEWLGDAMVFDVGPQWLTFGMSDRASLNAIPVVLEPLQKLCQRIQALGISAYAIDDGQVWVRSLCPEPGVMEDPVCGSGNGAVAFHRLHTHALQAPHHYVARQGEKVGRDGYVHVQVQNNEEVWVGGEAQIVVSGNVDLC